MFSSTDRVESSTSVKKEIYFGFSRKGLEKYFMLENLLLI